ncbi:MAG: NTP transferase domain-containing protein [Candidatus Lokiarchaeota archaeon]|nr:NTP transferase domain-containing protein [Candidatus Lokiarchaeota archaeon]
MNEDLTVAILAGGNSSRFRTEKALAHLQGKPLILHMLEIARMVCDNIIIIVSEESQQNAIAELTKSVRIIMDPEGKEKSALSGAITAFEYAETRYVMLLPVDTPLVVPSMLKVLYEMIGNHGAIVPSWPSGHIEPLHAVYQAEHAYSIGLELEEQGKLKMSDLLDRIRNVIYISTEVLKQFDPNLDSFVNINTERDLKKIEKKMQQRK